MDNENMDNQNTQTSSRGKGVRINVTMRDVWAIQKQEGGRWGLAKDSQGVWTFSTRNLARAAARTIRNTSPNVTIRVAKLTAKT